MIPHDFRPSDADPNRCGELLPSTRPWPAPPTTACWAPRQLHRDAQGEPTDEVTP